MWWLSYILVSRLIPRYCDHIPVQLNYVFFEENISNYLYDIRDMYNYLYKIQGRFLVIVYTLYFLMIMVNTIMIPWI